MQISFKTYRVLINHVYIIHAIVPKAQTFISVLCQGLCRESLKRGI